MYTVVTAATIITRKHEPDIVKVCGTKRLPICTYHNCYAATTSILWSSHEAPMEVVQDAHVYQCSFNHVRRVFDTNVRTYTCHHTNMCTGLLTQSYTGMYIYIYIDGDGRIMLTTFGNAGFSGLFLACKQQHEQQQTLSVFPSLTQTHVEARLLSMCASHHRFNVSYPPSYTMDELCTWTGCPYGVSRTLAFITPYR